MVLESSLGTLGEVTASHSSGVISRFCDNALRDTVRCPGPFRPFGFDWEVVSLTTVGSRPTFLPGQCLTFFSPWSTPRQSGRPPEIPKKGHPLPKAKLSPFSRFRFPRLREQRWGRHCAPRPRLSHIVGMLPSRQPLNLPPPPGHRKVSWPLPAFRL